MKIFVIIFSHLFHFKPGLEYGIFYGALLFVFCLFLFFVMLLLFVKAIEQLKKIITFLCLMENNSKLTTYDDK